MNERVKELLEQFSAQSLEKYDWQWIFNKEKFAELIVRECASKVTRNEALNIFEHFGIEGRTREDK